MVLLGVTAMTVRKIVITVLLAGACAVLICGCGEKKKDTTPGRSATVKIK